MHKLNNFFLILIYLSSFNFFYNFEHIFYSCFYTTKQEENNTNFLIFYFFLIIQFEKKKDLYILQAVPPTVVAGQGERGSRQQWLRDRLGLHKTSYLHVIFEDTMIFEDSKDLLTHSFHF